MNHQSALDPILVIAFFKPKVYFWGKKELFKGRLFSWFLRKIGVISIDRNGQDLLAVKSALKLLKEEKKFVVFPEGTRNTDDTQRMLKLKQGVAMLAIKAKSPIRLAYMFRKPKAFRRNYIMVSDEFSMEEFYGEKLTGEVLDKAMEIIEHQYTQLQEKLTETLVLKGKTVKM